MLVIIGALASAAVSFISSVGSAIGSLAPMAKTMLELVGKHIGPIANIVSSIAQVMGIFKHGDAPEDLGRKATLSDQKPEDFDSTEAYIDHLRNEVHVDKEKIKNETDAEKLAYTALGASMAIKGIDEKKGFETPIGVWATFAKLGMENNAKEINALLDAFKEDASKIQEYAEGKLDAKEEMKVGDQLAETYKEMNPTMSETDIEKKVMQMEISGGQQ